MAFKDRGVDLPAFGAAIILTLLVGGALTLIKPVGDFRRREGFAVVGIGWVLIVVLGALPFYLSGTVATYTDAFFETMSGFTTTGATIFPAVESVPRGVLLWRSLTHWLGGMGIIVLSWPFSPSAGNLALRSGGTGAGSGTDCPTFKKYRHDFMAHLFRVDARRNHRSTPGGAVAV